MMKKIKNTIYVSAFIFGMSTIANATPVIMHRGLNDPSTEGWTFVPGGGGGVTTGSITDSGTPAWYVDDDASVNGSIGWYQYDVTATETVLGNSAGWSLNVTMKNVDVPDVESGSTMVAYRDGTTSWQLQFGSENDGDPIVLARTSLTNDLVGSRFVLENTGNTFNTFQLIYDPALGSADLLVNGVEQISDYTGITLNQAPKVFWGAGRSPDTGRGHYSSVEFSVVPIPAALPLLLSGLGIMSLRLLTKTW